MTFRDYLLSRRALDNEAGNFTRQAREYPEMDEIQDWPHLRAFIYKQVHPEKVKATIAAAEPVWKGYRTHILKHRRIR